MDAGAESGGTRLEYVYETEPPLPTDRLVEALSGRRGWFRRNAAKGLRRLRTILEENRDRGARATIAGSRLTRPMTRLARFALLCLAAVAAVGGVRLRQQGGGHHLAETEGIYVTVDDVKYQIQISRILDPASPEDQAYLRGAARDGDAGRRRGLVRASSCASRTTPTSRTRSPTSSSSTTRRATSSSRSSSTPRSTCSSTSPSELEPGTVYPELNAPASDNTIRGGLLLFKIPAASLGNRPLEFEIESPSGGENAIIDIDV